MTPLEMENLILDICETKLIGSGSFEWSGVKVVISGLFDDKDGSVRCVALLMKNEQLEKMFEFKCNNTRLLVAKFKNERFSVCKGYVPCNDREQEVKVIFKTNLKRAIEDMDPEEKL